MFVLRRVIQNGPRTPVRQEAMNETTDTIFLEDSALQQCYNQSPTAHHPILYGVCDTTNESALV